MTKKEKAEKIISYLGGRTDSWITFDASPSGRIVFTIKGMNKDIDIYSEENITDSYQYIARSVIDAGFEYGDCKRIVDQERIMEAEKKANNKELSDLFAEALQRQEQLRIAMLSEREVLKEIADKYGINVVTYEKVNQQ